MVESIIESFDVWTDAHGVKTKGRSKSIDNISLKGIVHLRELILELAVRGKLVPQNPTDEPASKLLKKIEKEKEKLITEGKIKKEKSLPEIKEEEKPFELPNGWEIARFGSLAIEAFTGLDKGKSLQRSNASFRYFKMNNILNDGGFDLADLTFIDATEGEVEKYSLSDGDFLFNTRNSRELVGKTCVIRGVGDEPLIYNNNILKVKFNFIIPEFVDIWLRSTSGKSILEKIKSNTTNVCAIYQGKLLELVCPIAPFNEQQHIVAKVEELMALCDELEREKTTSLKTHQTLVTALLQTLTAAKDAGELEKAWHRLAPHFDTLFCTEDSIEQLKQTILQLAVMGRLVKQDPADEPASELLKKIEKEKEKLLKDGKIKREKPLPEIGEEEKPFNLPYSWEWSRLGQVTGYGFTEKVEPGDVTDDTWVLELEDIEKISSKLLQKVRVAERPYQSSKNKFLKGDVIYGKLRPYLDKVLIADEDGICTTEMMPVRGYRNIIPSFLRLVLKSTYFIEYATNSTHGMNLPRLGTDKARLALFPITSENEQHRIVAKVEELMASCDYLKERLSKSQEIQNNLSKTIVENAIA